MDLQFIWMFFRTLIALFFVVLLIYISLKYGGSKFQKSQNGRFVRIIEKTQLSKENSLFVIKMGERAYVLSSSSGKIEIIYELDKNEILELENKKNIPEYKNFKDFYKKSGMKKIIKNLKIKKEDKHGQ